MYKKYIKRILDICCAVSAMLLFSLVYAAVALWVRINLGSPIIFKQERIGKNGTIFTLYKFRTMTQKRDLQGKLLPDYMRLTRFSKLLRKTGLDELPEAFNILKGDMSVIGPRPLLFEYLQLYTPYQARRHEVTPGLSGLAQVSGRNTISWEEKFDFDIQYIENITFINDVKLVFKTLSTILKPDKFDADKEFSVPYFSGTKQKEHINA